MVKNFVLVLFLFLAIRPVLAQEFSSLEGTYEISGRSDLRTATVSKIVLEQQKGQRTAHAWFYNANGDVDWGTCVLKEYSQPESIQNHQYVAQFKHNQDESFVVLDPNGNQQLMVRSYTSYANADSKHPNLFCSDDLRRIASPIKP